MCELGQLAGVEGCLLYPVQGTQLQHTGLPLHLKHSDFSALEGCRRLIGLNFVGLRMEGVPAYVGSQCLLLSPLEMEKAADLT